VSADSPALLIMLGGMRGGRIEQTMRRALEAAAFDTAETALATGRFGQALLLTDAEPGLDLPRGLEVETDSSVVMEGGPPFHFSRRLLDAVTQHGIERFLYLGGGGGPLLGATEVHAIIDALQAASGPRCVTNNRFSADLFALTEPGLLARLDPLPHADNAVPRRLYDEHGVEIVELPRTLETQFNIDTPNDLAALALSRRAGPRLAAVAEESGFDTSRLAAAARCFPERTHEVLLAGRISATTWRHLESEAACRLRVISEERGMQAVGTDAAGTARSLLGQWIAEAGPRRAFTELLPELCDAAFIDIRPALVQLGIRPSRADRFAGDLGDAAAIEDLRLREIVEAANAAPVPVVLGGHSLVGGVLMLVNQWAWDERDGLV
jgi:hypothetical protein